MDLFLKRKGGTLSLLYVLSLSLGHYRRCQPRTSASLMIHKEKVPRSLALEPGSPTQGQRNIQVLPFSLRILRPKLPTSTPFPLWLRSAHPFPAHQSSYIFSIPPLLFSIQHLQKTPWAVVHASSICICVHPDTVCFMLRLLPLHMGYPEASH